MFLRGITITLQIMNNFYSKIKKEKYIRLGIKVYNKNLVFGLVILIAHERMTIFQIDNKNGYFKTILFHILLFSIIKKKTIHFLNGIVIPCAKPNFKQYLN